MVVLSVESRIDVSAPQGGSSTQHQRPGVSRNSSVPFFDKTIHMSVRSATGKKLENHGACVHQTELVAGRHMVGRTSSNFSPPCVFKCALSAGRRAYICSLGAYGAYGACVQGLSWWPAYGGGGRGGHPTLRRVTRPPGPPVRGAGVTLPPRTTHSSSTQGRGISTKHKIGKHGIRNWEHGKCTAQQKSLLNRNHFVPNKTCFIAKEQRKPQLINPFWRSALIDSRAKTSKTCLDWRTDPPFVLDKVFFL